MGLPRPTHILLIIDHLRIDEAGLYALARWLIRLLRRCAGDNHRLSITCTSVKRRKDATADSHFVEFIEDNDIDILYPDRFGYNYSANQSELSIQDLVDHDKQYYRKLRRVNGVTHILLFAPLSQKACLSDGFVKRVINTVKERNAPNRKSQTKDCKDIKVIIFNQWSLSQRNSDYVSEVLQNVDIIVSVGVKLYAEWNQHIKDQNRLRHICLYPTFDEFSCGKPRFHSATHFIILTLHSSSLYEINESGTAECEKPNKFLKLLSRCISKVAQYIKANNQSGSALTWCIHCPGLDTYTKERLVDELKGGVDCPDLSIDIETKRTPVQDLINKCSLCIQAGNLDHEGFSGIETLLCGTPTLVLSDSDVGQMMKDVDDMFAEYFTLENETYKNLEENSPAWEKRILKLLSEKEHTFERTSHLLHKYLQHRNRAGEVSTFSGISTLTKDIFDIKNLDDECLKRAMKPNWKNLSIKDSYLQDRSATRQQKRHKDKRRENPIMASDRHNPVAKYSSSASESDTELKSPHHSQAISDINIENIGTNMADNATDSDDIGNHSTDDHAEGQACGGVKPKDPERIITIPNIEFEGLISSDEDPDITFNPITTKPKFLKNVRTFKRK